MRDMATPEGFDFQLLDDPGELAELEGWDRAVYRDFIALQKGSMSRDEFRAKYLTTKCILTLDMTGFTENCIAHGQINSLLRIFDAQKVCIPVLRDAGAHMMRAFADDLVALFDEPDGALDAAFEIHRRMDVYAATSDSVAAPVECCIGIGYGQVFAIGPNNAQGDEMNRSAKLGEDIARGKETLVTENVFRAARHRTDIAFVGQQHDDQLFPYYRAQPAS